MVAADLRGGTVMAAEERDRKEMERRRRLMRGEPIRELRSLPEAELSEQYDALMELSADPRVTNRDAQMRYVARAQVYADELVRRETIRQGKRMEALTMSLNRLTWVITVATIIGVLLTAWAVLSGA
jgi:hypothetical protein